MLGLLSCEKDTIVVNVIKPKKIIVLTEDYQDTTHYYYSGQNITKTESKDGLSLYEYRKEKLFKIKYFRKGDKIPFLYNEFEYNSENKLTKLKFYLNVNSTVEEWKGEPIDSYKLSAYYEYKYRGDKVMEFYHENSIDTYVLIEFDSNKNIVMKTERGDHNKQYIRKYTYDSKNHFFKNINYPVYGEISSTVNNILTEEKIYLSWSEETGITVIDSTKIKTTYTYNEDDYPVKIECDKKTVLIEYE